MLRYRFFRGQESPATLIAPVLALYISQLTELRSQPCHLDIFVHQILVFRFHCILQPRWGQFLPQCPDRTLAHSQYLTLQLPDPDSQALL